MKSFEIDVDAVTDMVGPVSGPEFAGKDGLGSKGLVRLAPKTSNHKTLKCSESGICPLMVVEPAFGLTAQ